MQGLIWDGQEKVRRACCRARYRYVLPPITRAMGAVLLNDAIKDYTVHACLQSSKKSSMTFVRSTLRLANLMQRTLQRLLSFEHGVVGNRSCFLLICRVIIGHRRGTKQCVVGGMVVQIGNYGEGLSRGTCAEVRRG